MKKLLLFSSLILLLVSACSSSKKTTKTALKPKPEWLINRPSGMGYYVGIGVVKKWGQTAFYQDDAKNKALAEMASQINAQISSTSVLHQVEDKRGISEILTNNIKSSSKEFLEGYEQVDSWEDETQYFVYFRLSKALFSQLKEKRKLTAMENAKSKYLEALNAESLNSVYQALSLYASTLEILKDYLNDDTTIEINSQKIEIATSSNQAINRLIGNLMIMPLASTIKTMKGEFLSDEKLQFKIQSLTGIVQYNIPSLFAYSGGYLRKDTDLSDPNGLVKTAIFQVNAINLNETLCASIDVLNLSRQLTNELIVRKLIESNAGKSACITIDCK